MNVCGVAAKHNIIKRHRPDEMIKKEASSRLNNVPRATEALLPQDARASAAAAQPGTKPPSMVYSV